MEIESQNVNKTKLDLNTIAQGITIIGEGGAAGPFESAEEMKKAFEELDVDGYDTVGEKPAKILK